MPVVPGAGSTVADAVQDVRRHLAGDGRVEYNRLNGAISTTSASSFTIEFAAGGIVAGSYVCVDEEVMYVTSVSGTTVNVIRGMLGTTAATHVDDSLVEVNPRFSTYDIKVALQQEIASWGSQLFQVATKEVEVSDLSTSRSGASSQAVNLDIDDIYFGLELRVEPPSSSGNTKWREITHWEVDRNANTTDFAAGKALIINEPVPSGTARLVYAAPFAVTTFNLSTTLEADIGLAGSMLDIPGLGAAWRLLAPREGARTDTRPHGVARADAAVPPGHFASAAQTLKRLRDERISQEAVRLRSKYPFKSR